MSNTNPPKTLGEFRCSVRLSSSCSTSGTRRVISEVIDKCHNNLFQEKYLFYWHALLVSFRGRPNEEQTKTHLKCIRSVNLSHSLNGDIGCSLNQVVLTISVLFDRNTQLYSSGVVAGVAVASIICTSVLCLIVLFIIRRLRQNKGQCNVNKYVVVLMQNKGQFNVNKYVVVLMQTKGQFNVHISVVALRQNKGRLNVNIYVVIPRQNKVSLT